MAYKDLEDIFKMLDDCDKNKNILNYQEYLSKIKTSDLTYTINNLCLIGKSCNNHRETISLNTLEEILKLVPSENEDNNLKRVVRDLRTILDEEFSNSLIELDDQQLENFDNSLLEVIDDCIDCEMDYFRSYYREIEKEDSNYKLLADIIVGIVHKCESLTWYHLNIHKMKKELRLDHLIDHIDSLFCMKFTEFTGGPLKIKILDKGLAIRKDVWMSQELFEHPLSNDYIPQLHFNASVYDKTRCIGLDYLYKDVSKGPHRILNRTRVMLQNLVENYTKFTEDQLDCLSKRWCNT